MSLIVTIAVHPNGDAKRAYTIGELECVNLGAPPDARDEDERDYQVSLL